MATFSEVVRRINAISNGTNIDSSICFGGEVELQGVRSRPADDGASLAAALDGAVVSAVGEPAGGWLEGAGSPPPPSPAVVAVELLQSKSRWTPDEVGYVPSGFRYKKRLRKVIEGLQGDGVPWLFVTLTFGAEKSGYERHRAESGLVSADCERCFNEARRKRFVGEWIREIRRRLPRLELNYCCVKEFQADGMLHFHLIVSGAKYLDKSMVEEVWGRGFVKVQHASEKHVGYLCKYLCKGIAREDQHPWLRAYSQRLRLTSSGRGFWGPSEVRGAAAAESPRTRGPAKTIGHAWDNPGKYVRTMVRVIYDTGEFQTRHVDKNIDAMMNLCLKLNLSGGWAKSATGRPSDGMAKFCAAGVSVRLDQLVHCGKEYIDSC